MKQKYFRQFTFELLIVGIYFSIILLLLKQNLSKSFFFLVFNFLLIYIWQHLWWHGDDEIPALSFEICVFIVFFSFIFYSS
jgi:hypothetical protein